MNILRRLPRTMPSLVLPVAVGVTMVLFAIFRWGGDSTVRMVDGLALVASSVYATVCAVRAARVTQGRSRKAWTVMAIALTAWALSNMIWTLRAIALGVNNFLSPRGLWHVVFVVLATVAMALFPIGPARGSRLRSALDGVTAALCLLLLTWLAALHRVYIGYTAHRELSDLRLLSPIVDLLLLTTALLIVGRAEPQHRREQWLLTAAITLLTVTDIGYGNLVEQDRFHPGSLLNLGWFAASVAFAAAARQSFRPSSPPQAAPASSLASIWLPYAPLLLAGTVGPAVIMSGFERVVVPLVVVAVVCRQAVAAWENRRLFAAAAEQALRDPLTGLSNRTLFHDRLSHAMALRQRDDRSVAVVSIDIDDFKLVNESLGHPVADTVLIRVGRRIVSCVRPGDTVARLGGDEFVLLLEGREEQSYQVAGRVVEAFDQPFIIDGEPMLVRLSVGIAVASTDEPDLVPEVLTRRADMAMYAAKRSRASGMYSYSSDMALGGPDAIDQGSRRPAGHGAAQIRLLGELRRAIDHAALELVYQPKQHLGSSRIIGVEALLRWPHPERGVLGPDAFMELVRQHGLMRRVTELVVARALDDAVRWQTSGVETSIAVNVFAPDLKDAGLPDALCRALGNRGLAPALLTVEITEDLILNDIGRVTAVLHRLREQAIRVAIDDFGSGFSALSYLRDLSIDEVKLDRRFISSITDDARAAAVVRAVIDLTHELDVIVVAEGIEDAGTADWLREHGCDIGQGYYFGEPVAASMIPELLSASG